jgi:MoxR-like ATPase
MLNIKVDYPDEDEEFHIVQATTGGPAAVVERVVSAVDLLEMQDLVRKVPVAPYVIRYALRFTRLTRKEKGDVPDFIKDYVTWGAGPRASQYLILAAKARAVLNGRPYVSCEDVRAVAPPVLRHRIMTNFNAEADGVKPVDIVRRLIDLVPREAEKG